MSDNLDYTRHSQKSFKVDSSAANIPSAFSASTASSLVISGIAKARGFTMVNETTSRLAVNYKLGDSSTPPGSGQSNVDAYLPPASSGSFTSLTLDNVEVASTIYIKSDTGSAISTGLVYGHIW